MTARIVALAPARMAKLATRANAAHAQALGYAGKAVECAVAAGNALLEAKAQLSHGAWLPWLEQNVSFSQSTAKNYMRLATIIPALTERNRQRVGEMSLREAVKAVAGNSRLAVLGSSESSDWHTPEHIAELASECLGSIALDPCAASLSPIIAQRRLFSDGLARTWRARSLWMNPPFDEVEKWVTKLADEYRKRNVKSALALTAAQVDASWFRLLDPYPVCFVHGRLQFANSSVTAPFPTCITYFGSNTRRFAAVFGRVGTIRVRYLS